MIKTYIDLHVKYPLFLSHFKGTCIFSTDFSKNTKTTNFMKIRAVGPELFHAEGRTDERTESRDEAKGRFPQFCERT